MNRFLQGILAIERAAPLLPAAAGLIAGVVTDRYMEFPLVSYAVCFVLAGSAMIPRRLRTNFGVAAVLVASVCVGGVLHHNQVRRVPPSSIERYADDEPVIARVSGLVVSPPRLLKKPDHLFARWTFATERTAFLLEVESIEGTDGDIGVTGCLRVVVGEAVLDLRENERVELFGKLYRLPPPDNPGAYDWRLRYRRQGVVAGMRCNHRENVRRLDDHHRVEPPNLVERLRSTVRGLLTDDLVAAVPEEAGLLEAMVLGHRSRLDRRLNEVFIKAGCIHFLAVSGLHVGVVALVVLGVGRLLRASRRRLALWMAGAVILYAIIAEPRPPILRASVMMMLFCVSLRLRRPRSGLNWMCAAVLVLVLILSDPAAVFDVGFQLSFTAVLGIIFLTPWIANGIASLFRLGRGGLPNRKSKMEALEFAQSGEGVSVPPMGVATRAGRISSRLLLSWLAVSMGAWTATLPIIACHFQRVQPWGAVNSCIVFPLVFATMVLGFMKVACSAVLPGLGSLIAFPLAAVDSLLVQVVEWLSLLPGASVDVTPPPASLVVLYYALLALTAWRFRRDRLAASTTFIGGQRDVEGQRNGFAHNGPAPPADEELRDSVAPGATGPRDGFEGSSRDVASSDRSSTRRLNLACAAALACLVLGATVWLWPRGAVDRLVVTVLAVGNGSATVVELPDGRTILYDAGTMAAYDVGRSTIVPFLRHRGIRSIDRVYLSHANLDHLSGLPSVIAEIPTGKVVVNEYFVGHSGARSPARRLLEWLEERNQGMEVLEPSSRRWEMGGVKFERLWPLGEPIEGLSSNNASMVLKLTYSGRSILLTGDIEEHPQRMLIDRGGLEADVLILPHHGGVRSSSLAFVEAVDPEIVIRSSGQRMADTLSGLDRVVGNRTLLNTADVGAVEVVVDARGVHAGGMRPLGGR